MDRHQKSPDSEMESVKIIYLPSGSNRVQKRTGSDELQFLCLRKTTHFFIPCTKYLRIVLTEHNCFNAELISEDEYFDFQEEQENGLFPFDRAIFAQMEPLFNLLCDISIHYHGFRSTWKDIMKSSEQMLAECKRTAIESICAAESVDTTVFDEILFLFLRQMQICTKISIFRLQVEFTLRLFFTHFLTSIRFIDADGLSSYPLRISGFIDTKSQANGAITGGYVDGLTCNPLVINENGKQIEVPSGSYFFCSYETCKPISMLTITLIPESAEVIIHHGYLQKSEPRIKLRPPLINFERRRQVASVIVFCIDAIWSYFSRIPSEIGLFDALKPKQLRNEELYLLRSSSYEEIKAESNGKKMSFWLLKDKTQCVPILKKCACVAANALCEPTGSNDFFFDELYQACNDRLYNHEEFKDPSNNTHMPSTDVMDAISYFYSLKANNCSKFPGAQELKRYLTSLTDDIFDILSSENQAADSLLSSMKYAFSCCEGVFCRLFVEKTSHLLQSLFALSPTICQLAVKELQHIEFQNSFSCLTKLLFSTSELQGCKLPERILWNCIQYFVIVRLTTPRLDFNHCSIGACSIYHPINFDCLDEPLNNGDACVVILPPVYAALSTAQIAEEGASSNAAVIVVKGLAVPLSSKRVKLMTMPYPKI